DRNYNATAAVYQKVVTLENKQVMDMRIRKCDR
ncbi:hypothetical protein G914_04877, partial [Escherichia coli UMEA 3139-1]